MEKSKKLNVPTKFADAIAHGLLLKSYFLEYGPYI